MKSMSALLLAACVAADPMVYTAPDGTMSAHLSGGHLHNVHRHDEECANLVKVNCQVEEGWAWSTCTKTCGQGSQTRTRAITVEVSSRLILRLLLTLIFVAALQRRQPMPSARADS
jgi:hypothetical protein